MGDMGSRKFLPAHEHSIDAHCDVDPETDLCRICGVHHGDPCIDCDGRAFHLPNCDTLITCMEYEKADREYDYQREREMESR